MPKTAQNDNDALCVEQIVIEVNSFKDLTLEKEGPSAGGWLQSDGDQTLMILNLENLIFVLSISSYWWPREMESMSTKINS